MKWYGFGSCNSDDIGFIICFANEADVEKGIKCCNEGMGAWLNPDNIEEYPEDFPHLTEDDYSWVHDSGWCEPAMEILKMENIEDYIMETPWDENGELLCEFKDYNIQWM